MLEVLQKQVGTMDSKEKHVITVWKWRDMIFSTCRNSRIRGPGLDIICLAADCALKRIFFLDESIRIEEYLTHDEFNEFNELSN